MHEKATQFEILNRVDVGGMAEIFRARNIETGEILAIKRILPSLVGQAEFVKMFIDEAGVCLSLKHPNIVRVDQIGMMDNSLFMSMEYVDGTNLREVLSFANQYNFILPIHEAVRIAICILDGLQYAHVHTNEKGETLNLIHRDVSPPNILLGYNGEVKITDFGLVKSKSQISKTVPGLIKGKFSYLSPEAAYGESIDLRSDIYAVGIVLWEMLTSRPLFVDPVEMKILDLVRKSIVPSVRSINPLVPEALEAIVMKGLARDRAKRYPTAQAFADDLRGFLDSIGNPPSELGDIVSKIKPRQEVQAKEGEGNPGEDDLGVAIDSAVGLRAQEGCDGDGSRRKDGDVRPAGESRSLQTLDGETASSNAESSGSALSVASENQAVRSKTWKIVVLAALSIAIIVAIIYGVLS